MKYFNIKSIVLGIGIGVIMTASTGMIYFNFVDDKEPLSKEEIIQEAKKLGMVEANSLIDKTVSNTPTISTPNPTSTPVPTIVATPQATPAVPPTINPTPGPEVIITVESGDTAVVVARKLYDSKLIVDQGSFINKMIDSKAAYKMIAKEHTLRQGMTEQEIINKLITK